MEGPSCDRGKESLLQLTGGDVLLVRCVFDCVCSTQPHSNLLASSAWVVRHHHPFCHGHRLRCELGQESHSSLRVQCATTLDRRRCVLAIRGKHPSRQSHSDLAIRPHWSRRSVSSGVASCTRRAPRGLEGERVSDE